MRRGRRGPSAAEVLRAPWSAEWRAYRPGEPDDGGIRISVVMPTYRRPELLERCLTALLRQDYDADAYEILVCDDAASEETRVQVETAAERLVGVCEMAGAGGATTAVVATRRAPVVRYIPVTGATHGPAAARNRGWRAARGAVIAFTDDDTVPDATWLRAGEDAIEGDADAAWGRTVVPVPAVPTDYERDAGRLAEAQFVTANCFCRREVLAQLGGFDERFRAAWREDADLYFSLLSRGYRVVHAPQAVVVHPVRPARWGVSIGQQRKSMFNALLYRKHPALYRRIVQSGPPRRYYAIVAALAGAVTGALTGHAALALAALAVWALLTLAFAAYRLRDTSRAPRHVAEMLVTSAVIPPLSVFWRLRGALRFRVLFM